jgi:enoyl-CoA hydratase/carnithine racemase
MYTGRTISAADALQIGMVDSVVPLDQLDAVCHEVALTSAAENARPDLPPPFCSLAEFFDCHSADDLREGRADTQGNDVLARAMRSIAAKAPIALRIVERLIDDGTRRSLADGLAMEIKYVPVIYRTSDAVRGLTHLASKKFGAAKFDGR